MTRINPFAGAYNEERNQFTYADMTWLGRTRRWWYRIFWRDCPW